MQHLFILSIFLAVISIVFMIFKVGFDRATTISLHGAKHPVGYLGLALGLTLSVLLNAIFLFGWMQDAKRLSGVAVEFYSVLMLFILITSWVPDVTGWKRRIHRSAAYGIVLTIPLLLLSLLLSPISSSLITTVILTSVLAQSYCLYLLFKVNSAKNNFLSYQCIYLLTFFMSMGSSFTYKILVRTSST